MKNKTGDSNKVNNALIELGVNMLVREVFTEIITKYAGNKDVDVTDVIKEINIGIDLKFRKLAKEQISEIISQITNFTSEDKDGKNKK